MLDFRALCECVHGWEQWDRQLLFDPDKARLFLMPVRARPSGFQGFRRFSPKSAPEEALGSPPTLQTLRTGALIHLDIRVLNEFLRTFFVLYCAYGTSARLSKLGATPAATVTQLRFRLMWRIQARVPPYLSRNISAICTGQAKRMFMWSNSFHLNYFLRCNIRSWLEILDTSHKLKVCDPFCCDLKPNAECARVRMKCQHQMYAQL